MHIPIISPLFKFLFADRAVSIINDHATNNSDIPMFLYVPFQNVHWPYQVPKKYEDMYPNVKNKWRRIYSGIDSLTL